MEVNRSRPKWDILKPNMSKSMKCPRCGNTGEFNMSVGSTSYFHLGFTKVRNDKQYAYKCPICPYYEEVLEEVVKALAKRNG
jgi:predicted nucleic-acid-binding Zn-ribbon protein